MKYFIPIYLTLVFFLNIGCSKNENPQAPENNAPDLCEEQALSEGKIFYENTKKLLYGGKEDWMHFEIDNFTLKACNLSHALGRENFQAIYQPEYIPVREDADKYYSYERTIVIQSDTQTLAYPINLVRSHEVVNDVVDGEPIAIVYCILADFFRVYSRRVCDTVFTFALSGYTYAEANVWGGRSGFVWWDRETESLWWPLIDEAVSGKMMGASLTMYPHTNWEELSWGEVLEKYPKARVLKRGQSMEIPDVWVKYNDLPCMKQ